MPDSLKDDILSHVDLVDVISERVPLQKKGREFVGLCPFHDDHKPSMTVVPEKGLFKCFSCGAGGDVFKFVQLYERVNFKTAMERLAERAGLNIARTPEERARNDARDKMRRVLQWADKHFQAKLADPKIGTAARDYARERGLTDETLSRFGIGLAPDQWTALLDSAKQVKIDSQLLAQVGLTVQKEETQRVYDRFRNRLMFPIRDPMGRAVAFGGRALKQDDVKYVNSSDSALFNKSRILYAFDLARDAIRSTGQAIVVEGYMDAIMLHQAGVTNVVATLGTALTDAHMQLLKSQVNEIVLCFDGDAAGVKAANRGVETAVRHNVSVKVLILPDGADPDDFVQKRGVEAFRAAVEDAVEALTFKWEQTRETLVNGEQRDRRSTIEDFMSFVGATTARGDLDPLEFGDLVRRIGELIGLPQSEIYRLLTQNRATIEARAQRQANIESTEPSSEDETYRDSLRGLPLTLVGPVEMTFGILLSEPQLFDLLDDRFDQAVGHNEFWREFFDLLCESVDKYGAVKRDEVIGLCENNAQFDLLNWAELEHRLPETSVERVALFHGLLERLSDALTAMSYQDAKEMLADSVDPGHASQRYKSMLEAAKKKRPGFLPFEAN